MARPQLSSTLSSTEFMTWYWLKDELVQFCRAEQLPVSGSKQEVAARIAAYLSGAELPSRNIKPAQTGVMPTSFKMETVIGSGWRCTQELRVFFVSRVGKSFRFNDALRSFISTREGSTLHEAIEHYKASLDDGHKVIANQFEYNRHMRQFHSDNPGTSHVDAVESWWKVRGKSDG